MCARARVLGVQIIERKLEGSVFGYYDAATHTITIDPRLSQAQRRSTLAHELVHAERRDKGCSSAWHEIRQERRVEEVAARLLIRLDRLADALAWAHGELEVAEELSVDVPMVRARIEHLSPAEVEYIETRLASREVMA